MAITKILAINEVDVGNPAGHLKQAIEYIQNGDKTNEKVLVGSLNCSQETAYKQMLETKNLFGKTDKRQGFHIIISFVPGEATEQQAFDVMEKFSKEFLGDDYEAIYSVHTDKNHMHGHLIWNSVNMNTGKKYDYRKGDWKRVIQPITNRLCEEHKLSIMPAEYAKKPTNLTRNQWELEEEFKGMIYQDAKFCIANAGDEGHFIFLMKGLGYEFEKNKYLSVRVPGRRKYHRLVEIDEMFEEENIKSYMNNPYQVSPHYYSRKPQIYYGMTSFQKKYYTKIYQLRMVEESRFYVKSAKYAKDLKRMHLLQEQYLYIMKNDVKDIGDLIDSSQRYEDKINDISDKQKELYKQNYSKKRSCKTPYDWQEYQKWQINNQKQLELLKQEKKEYNDELKIIKRIINTSVEPVMGSLMEKISDRTDVVIPPMPKEEIIKENSVKKDVAVSLSEVPETTDEHIPDNVVEDANNSKVVVVHKLPKTFMGYKNLSTKAKMTAYGFDANSTMKEIQGAVLKYLDQFEGDIDIVEMLDEVDLISDAVRNGIIEDRVDLIADRFRALGDYRHISSSQKAVIYEFGIGENDVNLKLQMKVIEKLGLDMDVDEIYEDYQGIYDATVISDVERGGRGR